MSTLPADAQDLETAEEFLNHFGVPFDQRVVNVNRLHILQRFHDYLAAADLNGLDDEALSKAAREHLERAYNDFVSSDALANRVFRGLRSAHTAPTPHGRTFLPLSAVERLPKTENTTEKE
jgi:nitrogenase-stabilizing/protective protein